MTTIMALNLIIDHSAHDATACHRPIHNLNRGQGARNVTIFYIERFFDQSGNYGACIHHLVLIPAFQDSISSCCRRAPSSGNRSTKFHEFRASTVGRRTTFVQTISIV